MNVLLDTHVLLWALGEPERLPSRTADRLADPETFVFMSPINTWEIAIKASVGRLRAPFDAIMPTSRQLGFKELPITIAHTLAVKDLPHHHRDPFDRLLVAQAMIESLTLVSRDPMIARYPVEVIWD